MDIYRGVESIPPDAGLAALTIGNFDGVHLAHREICRIINREAQVRGGRSAVLTFDPHPLSVVAPERMPPLMTTLDEKLARLAEQGLGAVVVQPFTPTLAKTEAAEFIRRIIREGVRPALVAIGFNFRFGKGRAGDVALLESEGAKSGFAVKVIAPFLFEERRVSSTEIRALIAGGDVEEAGRRLGQYHLVEGPVIHGEGRGRTIGIPTANVDYPSILLPANGVYACWVQVEGRSGPRLPAVTNVGERPTFEGGRRVTVEAHLLEGGADLYGRTIRVEFVARIRAERKFENPGALVAQIRADIEAARERLAQAGPAPS